MGLIHKTLQMIGVSTDDDVQPDKLIRIETAEQRMWVEVIRRSLFDVRVARNSSQKYQKHNAEESVKWFFQSEDMRDLPGAFWWVLDTISDEPEQLHKRIHDIIKKIEAGLPYGVREENAARKAKAEGRPATEECGFGARKRGPKNKRP